MAIVIISVMLQPFAGTSEFQKPYDSSMGIPVLVFFIVLAFALYVGVRVYISVKKDENTENDNPKAKEEHRQKFITSLQKLRQKY